MNPFRRFAIAIAGLITFCTVVPACLATPFTTGDFTTFTHDEWGNPAASGGINVGSYYDTVYPGGILIVGIFGISGNSIVFDDKQSLLQYLPDNGTPGPLDNDYTDPLATLSGIFGSNVIALSLNIDFGDAGILAGSHSIKFGDLVIGADVSGMPSLAADKVIDSNFVGLTVRQFAELSNQVLGGAVPYSTSYLQTAMLLNDSFDDAIVSDTAQRQLFVPSSPPPDVTVPEPATWAIMLTGLGLVGGAMRKRRRAN